MSDVYRKGHGLTFNGATKPISQWAREVGLNEATLRYRLAHGWTASDALSRPSRGGGKPVPPLRERFPMFVEKRGDGCWAWVGNTDGNGYGLIYVPPDERGLVGGAINGRAHRVAYALYRGALDGRFVLHDCDNPSCVNPSHLRLGSHEENMNDMTGRQRSARGVRQHLAKLNPDAVREMRRLHRDGWGTPRLARRFGVAQQTAWMAVTRRTWRHVA